MNNTTSTHPIQVVIADEEADQFTNTLLAAFRADLVARWLFPKDDLCSTGFPEFIRAFTNPSLVHGTALYERHGFRLLGEIQAGSSPSLHPMIRKPQ